jgi:hypothetical protein
MNPAHHLSVAIDYRETVEHLRVAAPRARQRTQHPPRLCSSFRFATDRRGINFTAGWGSTTRSTIGRRAAGFERNANSQPGCSSAPDPSDAHVNISAHATPTDAYAHIGLYAAVAKTKADIYVQPATQK